MWRCFHSTARFLEMHKATTAAAAVTSATVRNSRKPITAGRLSESLLRPSEPKPPRYDRPITQGGSAVAGGGQRRSNAINREFPSYYSPRSFIAQNSEEQVGETLTATVTSMGLDGVSSQLALTLEEIEHSLFVVPPEEVATASCLEEEPPMPLEKESPTALPDDNCAQRSNDANAAAALGTPTLPDKEDLRGAVARWRTAALSLPAALKVGDDYEREGFYSLSWSEGSSAVIRPSPSLSRLPSLSQLVAELQRLVQAVALLASGATVIFDTTTSADGLFSAAAVREAMELSVLEQADLVMQIDALVRSLLRSSTTYRWCSSPQRRILGLEAEVMLCCHHLQRGITWGLFTTGTATPLLPAPASLQNLLERLCHLPASSQRKIIHLIHQLPTSDKLATYRSATAAPAWLRGRWTFSESEVLDVALQLLRWSAAAGGGNSSLTDELLSINLQQPASSSSLWWLPSGTRNSVQRALHRIVHFFVTLVQRNAMDQASGTDGQGDRREALRRYTASALRGVAGGDECWRTRDASLWSPATNAYLIACRAAFISARPTSSDLRHSLTIHARSMKPWNRWAWHQWKRRCDTAPVDSESELEISASLSMRWRSVLIASAEWQERPEAERLADLDALQEATALGVEESEASNKLLVFIPHSSPHSKTLFLLSQLRSRALVSDDATESRSVVVVDWSGMEDHLWSAVADIAPQAVCVRACRPPTAAQRFLAVAPLHEVSIAPTPFPTSTFHKAAYAAVPRCFKGTNSFSYIWVSPPCIGGSAVRCLADGLSALLATPCRMVQSTRGAQRAVQAELRRQLGIEDGARHATGELEREEAATLSLSLTPFVTAAESALSTRDVEEAVSLLLLGYLNLLATQLLELFSSSVDVDLILLTLGVTPIMRIMLASPLDAYERRQQLLRHTPLPPNSAGVRLCSFLWEQKLSWKHLSPEVMERWAAN